MLEDAEALDRPEGAERREQQPHRELDRVLGDTSERLVQREPGDEDDCPAGRRACDRRGHRVRVQPEGDDDEDHLEAFEEDALETDDEAEPVEAGLRLRTGAAGRLGLLAEGLLLVVQRLQPRRAEDRLAQPLQAEDEQQAADDELEQALREPVDQRVARDAGHAREEHERADRAGDGRAPAARQAHREHDREGLDELDGRGEQGRSGESGGVPAHGHPPLLKRRLLVAGVIKELSPHVQSGS